MQNDSFYIKHGQQPPEHINHELTPDDISEKVKRLTPTNWRAEGNRLIADTPMGPLVQLIPPDHLFTGTDKQGLPKFRIIANN